MLRGGGSAINRSYYELRVLSELCARLHAGDVWVVGSSPDIKVGDHCGALGSDARNQFEKAERNRSPSSRMAQAGDVSGRGPAAQSRTVSCARAARYSAGSRTIEKRLQMILIG